MSDWKSRATPVANGQPSVAAIGSPNGETGAQEVQSDWKSRAAAAPLPQAQEERPWYSVSPEGLMQGSLDALPNIGTGAGEMLGTLGGPAGILAGAAGGGALGKHTKELIEQYLLGRKPQTREEMYNGMTGAAVNGMTGAAVGQVAAPVVSTIGSKLYENALSPIEAALAKKGKSGIADVAEDAGIWNPKGIRDKLKSTTADLTDAVKQRYQQATAAGGELDVNAALEPAQAHVNDFRMKAGRNPELLQQADRMQKRIDMLREAGAKDVFKQAPEVTGLETAREAAPGEVKLIGPDGKYPGDPATRYQGSPIADSKGPLPEPEAPVVPPKVRQRLDVRNAYDYTPPTPESAAAAKQAALEAEAAQKAAALKASQDAASSLPVQGTIEHLPGPNIEQGVLTKQASQNSVGDAGYSEFAKSGIGKDFEKKIAGGYQKEVENAIGRALGPEYQAEVAAKNASIGKILDTRRAQQALQDLTARKIQSATSIVPNGTEGIAGAVVGAGTHNVVDGLKAALAVKALKGLSLAEMPAGYALKKAAPFIAGVTKNAPMVTQGLVNQSPWALQGDQNGQK